MRRRILELAVLLFVALGAPPISAAIWQWSTTPGTNADADPSINWSEGMSPSSVNDSARAMMAVLAAWRNDISVRNTTAGSSTAYTLTTSEGVNTTPVNGQMLAAIFHATNGAASTLTVDGGNTYPVWLNGSAVPAATLIAGSPYRFSFNSGSSAWVLEGGFASPFSTALGGVIWSTAPTAPNSNFVAPSGQCISTTTYAAYWVQQGSPASGACPGGQFAIIDMRGRVVAGLDTLNASAANRMTSSANGCGVAFTSVGAVCGSESQTLAATQLPTITSAGTMASAAKNYLTSPVTGYGITSYSANAGSQVWQAFSNGATIVVDSTVSVTGTLNSTNTGGTAHPIVQPTIGLIPYLRIL